MHGNWVVCSRHDAAEVYSPEVHRHEKPIQRVKFTKAIARHTKIRDQNPSLGYICPGEPHERSPTLQILRIGLQRRQSGKSKVPAKQRGS